MVERINKLIAQYGGGLTITELERRLGFSRGSIAKWDISLPNIERVDKVAKFFGVSIDYLQNGAGKERRAAHGVVPRGVHPHCWRVWLRSAGF